MTRYARELLDELRRRRELAEKLDWLRAFQDAQSVHAAEIDSWRLSHDATYKQYLEERDKRVAAEARVTELEKELGKRKAARNG